MDDFRIGADQFLDIPAFIFSAVYNIGTNNKRKIKEKEVPELDRIKKED